MSKEAMIPMGDPRKLIGKFAIVSDSKVTSPRPIWRGFPDRLPLPAC